MKTLKKLLTILLAAAILISIAFTTFISLTPGPRDKFSEFYLLNIDGQAASYPREVHAGESVNLLLGVVNHETVVRSYQVKIINNGVEVKKLDTGILPDGGKWEEVISLTPDAKGMNQKYEFFLYLTDSDLPHIKDPLVLRLDIK